MENITFECAKSLYNIWKMEESVYMEYLAEEMARQRTLKWINRLQPQRAKRSKTNPN
jgi:hypothetical protein